MDRTDLLEISVRELATELATLARNRDVADRMARIVERHPPDPEPLETEQEYRRRIRDGGPFPVQRRPPRPPDPPG